MSQENVELVRRINEAFNRGDFEPMSALADPPPAFEYVPNLAFGPGLGACSGGVRDSGGSWKGSGMKSTILISNSPSSSTRASRC
jgi:hypothetical protein